MYKYTNIYSIWVVQVGHVQVTWAGVSLNLAGYLSSRHLVCCTWCTDDTCGEISAVLKIASTSAYELD